jgi:type I restriction enzyme S subunit
MIEFKSIRIGKLGKVTTGRTPKTSVAEYYGNDFMFVGPRDLHKHYIISNSQKMISQAGLTSIKSATIDGLSICVGCIGWDMGNVALVKGKCATNQQINTITKIKSDYNPYYIYYWLKGKKDYLFQQASVTRTPILNKSSFSDIEIEMPIKAYQNKIADVLTSIDQKIELNNKINAKLEAMAKLIYDYWFVQFDFPSDVLENKGKPYKSSGGKMVYNEELKREIPEGWGAGNVMHLANLLGGGTPKTTVKKYWGGSIPFFTPADAESDVYCLKTKENITAEGLNSCSSRLYGRGTVFITARGTVGKINIASTDMAMNQSCYALQGKEGVGYEFIYYYAEELVSYVKSKASGSIFKALVTNDFKFTELVIPPMELIGKFIQTVESNFEKLLVNKQENHQLAELRDWLLPMLMNGQVTVKNTKEK